YSRQGLIRGTQRMWDQYEITEQDSVFKFYHIGIAQLVLGKTQACIDSMSKVLNMNPNFEKALYYRSRSYRMLGMLREAGRDLQKHLELRPRDPYANYALGICLMEVGRTPQAIACFNKALNDKPGYFKAHLQVAQAYLTLTQYEQAHESLKKALQISPQ
ncbi:unnamed protein product, partial [Phaeothamnion confervicola]